MSRVILAVVNLEKSILDYTNHECVEIIEDPNTNPLFYVTNENDAVGVMNSFFDDNPDSNVFFVVKSEHGTFVILDSDDVHHFACDDFGHLVSENLSFYNAQYVQARPDVVFYGHRSCLFFYTPFDKLFKRCQEREVSRVELAMKAAVDQTEDAVEIMNRDDLNSMQHYMPLIFVNELDRGKEERPTDSLGPADLLIDLEAIKNARFSHFTSPNTVQSNWLVIDSERNVGKFDPEVMKEAAENGDLYASVGLAVYEETRKRVRDSVGGNNAD